MRTSQFPLYTLKEDPSEAQLISHKLMIRAGFIRAVTSGIYTWMPLGTRVLQKIERIIREEMSAVQAVEIIMPCIQPSDLWEETGRWNEFGNQMLKMKDRHDRPYCFGPTHEEVITDMIRSHLKSYKQLPLFLYQIQTKFRDEIRPRFGVLRSREFIMKDGYSFHSSAECLKHTYERVYAAYQKILDRLGVNYCSVTADTGTIGGSFSHEFHIIADSGEDSLVYSEDFSYGANLELATYKDITPQQLAQKDKKKVSPLQATPNVQVLFLKDNDQKPVCILLRSEHTINEVKIRKLDNLSHYTEMSPQEHFCLLSSKTSYRLISDYSSSYLSDFQYKNHDGDIWIGINFGRDLINPELADVRNVVVGDLSPNDSGTLNIRRGIEVGHIFMLGDTYAKKMSCTYLDSSGTSQAAIMGCYGLGVSRIVAACIEQNHDDRGMIWNDAVAPFNIIITILTIENNEIMSYAHKIYTELKTHQIDVLLDDRDERAGSKFADADLIGIPHRITLGEKNWKNSLVEYKHRKSGTTKTLSPDQLVPYLLKRINLIVD